MRQLKVVAAALLLFPLVVRAMDRESAPRVEDSILRKGTLAPRATCGSSLACSVVGAIVLPDCRFDDLLGRVMAKATLRLMGTIYYFRGAFKSVREKPRDPSVVNQSTAIDHEYAYHITPAVNAVSGLLTAFESESFATVADCVTAGSQLAKSVTSVFQEALAETQVREKEGAAIARGPSRSPTATALLSHAQPLWPAFPH